MREIAATPGQELATHTFAHLYCGEPADNLREAFRADLGAARAIMRDTCGVEPRSIVFPRNQHNPALEDVLVQEGIPCLRGNPRAWMWQPGRRGAAKAAERALRFADTYLPAGRSYTARWKDVPLPSGAFNVPASFFLRPNLPAPAAARIRQAMRVAADRGELLHLWWHPHIFGVRTAENLATLRALLETFAEHRQWAAMESLTMAQAADRAAGGVG